MDEALIFINYRTSDASDMSSFLYDALGARFGRSAVFRDTASILGGDDYRESLLESVRHCTVLLVLIGPRWLTATGKHGDGRPALHEPDDWVRREIAEALAAGIRVFPVLIGDVSWPERTELPEDVREIVHRQGHPIRRGSERADIEALISELVEAEPRLAWLDRGSAESAAVSPARWGVLGAAGVSAMGAAVLVGYLTSAGPLDVRTILVAGLAIVGGALTWLARRRAMSARPGGPDRLDDAARALAGQVGEQTSATIATCALDAPTMVTHWDIAYSDRPHETPEWWTAGAPAELARTLTGLPRCRVAILGARGAGKTSLALLLVRELASWSAAGARVPVLVSLAGWDPDAGTLWTWLADQLVTDYPVLRDRDEVAHRLVARQRIIPVVDGLDELPETLQRKVMSALRGAPADQPWIVTCQDAAFAKLPSVSRRAVEATVTARPVTAAQAADYVRAQVGEDTSWQPVLDALTLARALSTPLDLWLFSRVYLEGERDPSRLSELADPDSVRADLLSNLVPSLLESRAPLRRDRSLFRLRRRWPRQAALNWLRNLANTRGTELAWWQLTEFGPRRPRLVLAGVLAVVTVLLVGGTGFLLAGGQALGPVTAFTIVMTAGAALCTAGYAEPAFASFALSGRIRALGSHLLEGAAAGVLLAGVFIVCTWFAGQLAPVAASFTPTDAIVTGLGLGAGVSVFRWASVPTQLAQARSPDLALRADRTLTVAFSGCFAVVAAAYSTYAMSGVVSGLAQLLLGAATVPSWFIWASFGPVRPGATGHAWSTYVLTVCLAALRGRLPLRTMAFLTDMHRIGILVPVGARYEFRHPALRRVLRDG